MFIFGKALRIAPGQSGQPIASFWKVWAEGGELYALNRDHPAMKISIHASGQIHMRTRERDLQPLAPPLSLPDTPWQLALEIRYLIAPDRTPMRPGKFKRKDKPILVDVADGQMLVLDLLVAPRGADFETANPPAFAGAPRLWGASLPDGRHALLLGRVMPLDGENQGHVERLRGPDGPKLTYRSLPDSPQTELTHMHGGPGGNIALIVPTGDEVIRKLGAPASKEADLTRRRQLELEFACPDASCEIHAPNGATVATLTLTGSEGRATVSKNEHVTTQIGVVSLALHEGRLIPGGGFVLPTIPLTAVPTIGGLRPRQWTYDVGCAYDGEVLKVAIDLHPVGLIPKGTTPPMMFFDDEQLSLTCPTSTLTLEVTPGQPTASAPLSATLILHTRE